MSWLDRFFTGGYAKIQVAGVDLAREVTLNFAAGATGADDPTSSRTNVSLAASSAVPMTIQNGTDADTTCNSNSVVFVPTTAAIRTYTLPASPANGTFVTVCTTNPELFNVVISGNGLNINDGIDTPAATYTITHPGQVVWFVFHTSSNTWRIL